MKLCVQVERGPLYPFYLHRDGAWVSMCGGAHGDGERQRMKRAERDAGCPTASPPPHDPVLCIGGVIPPPTYTGRPGGGGTVDESTGLNRRRAHGENSGRVIM